MYQNGKTYVFMSDQLGCEKNQFCHQLMGGVDHGCGYSS